MTPEETDALVVQLIKLILELQETNKLLLGAISPEGKLALKKIGQATDKLEAPPPKELYR
jgi:hypothetical protein